MSKLPQVLLIGLVVVLAYGLGVSRLPLSGEETCRARHGIEMAKTGNLLAPTLQSVPILDRPPLQYWTLAAVHKWIHKLDPATLRWSMVVVTLLTSLMIWAYARQILSERAAFLAALMYPTMGHVFDLGRRAETDALFTLFLAGSLMLWHAGYERGWSRLWVWVLGAGCAGLAALTKGLQAPVSFFGTVYLFLLIRGDVRRYVFHRSHLAGLLVFVAVIAVWQVPFYLRDGWEATVMCWTDPDSARLTMNWPRLVKHVTQFPFEVLGSTMPWSLLLFGMFSKRFWRGGIRSESSLLFQLLAVLIITGPIWAMWSGTARYVMPMYPLLAVVCATVVERADGLERGWVPGLVRVLQVLVVSLFLIVVVASVVATAAERWFDSPITRMLAQPWPLVVALVVGGALVVGWVRRVDWTPARRTSVFTSFGLAALLAISFNGPIVNAIASSAERVGPEIAAFRDSLPKGTRLVSFEPLHHKFVYFYRDDIPILTDPNDPEIEYFALNFEYGQVKFDVPFEWELVRSFNMDRRRRDDPDVSVLIGRRVHY